MTTAARLATLLLCAVASLAAAALPALAHVEDAQAPTNYVSEVTGLVGDGRGVRAGVGGGDAFIVLEVPRGVEVVVPGYEEPEQYLRVGPDGRVYVNVAGPSYWLNNDRYADVVVPESASPDAPPEWQVVALGGRFEWHDHRIHWMSPSPPRQIDTSLGEPQHVFDWEIPIVVDGQPVTITGTLTWLPSPSPLVPLGVAAAVAAATVGLVRAFRPSVAAAAVAAGAPAIAAVAVTAYGPPGAALAAHATDLAAAAAALGLAIAAVAGKTGAASKAGLLGVGSVALAVAIVANIDAVSSPLLPGPLPVVAAQVLVGFAAGAAVAGLATTAPALFGPASKSTPPATAGTPPA